MYHHACVCCKIVSALVIIGALNWGMVGLFGINVVDHFFGVGSVVSRVIYSLVGLAGVAALINFFKPCSKCVDHVDHVDHVDVDKIK